jgi:hypothetical protein
MSRRASPSDEESRAAGQPVGQGTGEGTGGANQLLDDIPRKVYDRLVKAAKDELIYSSNGNTILNLATLQRMLLFHLQLKIIKEAGPLANLDFSKGNPLDALNTPMADYGNSSRRYLNMLAKPANRNSSTGRT